MKTTAATAAPALTAPTTAVLLHVVQHVVPLALMARRVLLLPPKVVTSPLMPVLPSASARSLLRLLLLKRKENNHVAT